MKVKPQETALMVYLRRNHDVFHGKILELREAVQGWLEYVPQSFPHYTRHTIQHSDEIVLQLSKLLFKDDDPSKPVIRLSAAEVYILVASAYLHDIGMVISEKEKIELLKSSEWAKWTEENEAGHNRWVQIKEFRDGEKPSDSALRNFLADLQTRFLLADYVRRQHHMRGARLISMHEHALGRFAFDDPILKQTIANICVGHGLTSHELEDNELFPDRCDVQGQKVNARFLAILLRIGDLLDMSFDRACPLLLNAASPLPAESLAHWTKYQRITHRLTAPDRIELRADCFTQEEHRFLQDWCQWLADEIQESRVIMSRVERHSDWSPPIVNLEGPDQTIAIRRAKGASYIPSKWTFEMDQKAIFDRLMSDIYADPMAFVLELVQSALDATRCQMYIDLEREGLELPEYPTQVKESRRRRYPIKISLGVTERLNELSGETEVRQVITIEDCGIGMDNDIIRRYFLQVGRSYYQTDGFRRSFHFVPSSQFGIGFLSVFAVSDNVIVETYKPSSPTNDGPIRLTLRGPRSYLLTERGQRQSCGTRIEVMLRKPMLKGDLTERLKYWCKRVEFPIVIDELGAKQIVLAEHSDQFTYELPDLTEKEAKFILRAFPISQKGVEGELYMFTREDKKGVSWDKKDWALYRYPNEHPGAFSPNLPDALICQNGITKRSFGLPDIPGLYRIDVRCKVSGIRDIYSVVREAISSRLEEILKEHLTKNPKANLPEGWSYKQNLVKDFPLTSFWRSYPETIRFFIKGQPMITSLEKAESFDLITTTMDLTDENLNDNHEWKYRATLKVERNPSFDNGSPTLTHADICKISRAHRIFIFKGRRVAKVRWLKSNHLAIDWALSPEQKMDLLSKGEEGYLPSSSSEAKLPDSHTIGFAIHETIGSNEHILLNCLHPFVRWFLKIRKSQLGDSPFLQEEEFNRLLELIDSAARYTILEEKREKLQNFLDWQCQIRKLPSRLLPNFRILEDSFLLRPPTHRNLKTG
jgi:molecular chaperone HtpG